MQKFYVIKNKENGKLINFILLGRGGVVREIKYTNDHRFALNFENREEPQATITFIGAVMDWELEEQLEISEV